MAPRMIKPIGWVESPYKEKFGTPRQSGVVPSAEFRLHFHDPFYREEYFRGIEQFSHLWVISHFHLIDKEKQAALVRPPKLGGNEKVGVFASRSPFRPNQLCLSVGKLLKKDLSLHKVSLVVSGLDLVDQTPIYDLKPYLAYADSIPEANNGYAQTSELDLSIQFSADAQAAFTALSESNQALLRETLLAQPQPSYHSTATEYGMNLKGYNIRWKCDGNQIEIIRIVKEC